MGRDGKDTHLPGSSRQARESRGADGADDNCTGGKDEGLVGQPCNVNGKDTGACLNGGKTQCPQACVAAGAIIPADNFQTQAAPNGSFDWNCNGFVEVGDNLYGHDGAGRACNKLNVNTPALGPCVDGTVSVTDSLSDADLTNGSSCGKSVAFDGRTVTCMRELAVGTCKVAEFGTPGITPKNETIACR